MLVAGDPAGAILATCGQPPGNFGVAHGDKALIAVGVGTLGDELHRAGAVQADDAEKREGVVGRDAGVGGDVVVTAFQSACGLVNLVTPTAAVVMGALALGRIPYEKWLKFVWKLMVIYLLLTTLLLIAAALL